MCRRAHSFIYVLFEMLQKEGLFRLMHGKSCVPRGGVFGCWIYANDILLAITELRARRRNSSASEVDVADERKQWRKEKQTGLMPTSLGNGW